MSVLVVGSFIVDLVARTERAPQAGETVAGLSFDSYLGGKGANQAVAARRMGADVVMAGCVGDDGYGREFIDLFDREGIPARHVKISAGNKTGCSLVTVETSGQNRICMVAGSNLDYTVEDARALEPTLKDSRVVITQCEMRAEIADEVAAMCKKHGVKFILNPAPARPLCDLTLSATYVLTPNETELGIIVGRDLKTNADYEQACRTLINKGVQNVVVTLGAAGCLLVNAQTVKYIEGFKVKAVDTVGAGDSFTGSLGALIDEGYSVEDALRVCSAVGALAVQKSGAIPSMPYRRDVEKFIAERSSAN